MSYRVVGANFDQMHLNTNLEWVRDHPDAELVGVCDEDPSTSTGSLDRAVEELSIPEGDVYDDLERCIEATAPDIVLGAPMNAEHPAFVERVAPYGVHVAIEKPFAMSLADADRMLDAMDGADGRLAVNWPVTWDPVKHTVKRLVEAGTVGDVFEIQYYGGNAGAPPDGSWFYDAASGGGSMLDYLGYGATFSTWFRGGELPENVTAEAYVPEGMDVDVQSTSVCRFPDGLSTLQTSWRMFTHPWETEPQPPKGYEIAGPEGTISTRERGAPIRVQDAHDPGGRVVEPDPLPEGYENLVDHLVYCLENDEPFEGPTDPAVCREAQRLIEAAQRSAERGGPVDLPD